MLTLTKGKEINARYVIHDVVGTGGFATVWKASDKQLNRDVALKRLLKQGTNSPEQELKVLLDEARKHAQLVHTNIVQVYDVIEADGEHLIVMEFVDGSSLHQVLRDSALKGQTLPLDDAVALLEDILEGVSYAHERKTIHRDLSPSNILIRAGGVPKIADFGIARVLAATGTSLPPAGSTTMAGTGNPDFMSPEQARGEPADYMSDLFMVGIIGYLLLSGRHPFAHPSGLFTIPELLRDDAFTPEPLRPPPGLSSTQQRLFEEYAAVVMRLIQRPKAGRFASAQEALEAISGITPTLDCPSCGEPVPEHNRYCGQCGAAINVTREEPILKGVGTVTEPTVEQLLDRGYDESVARRWESAIALYRQALAKDPKNQKGLRNLGFVLNRLGRYEEAEQVLSEALRLTPKEPQHKASILVERSFARASRKDYDNALADIDLAIGALPRSVRALYSRARIHLFMGNLLKASKDAQEVLRLVPDHAGALRLLKGSTG